MADTGGGSGGSGPPYQTLGVFCFLYYPKQNHLQNPPKCTFQSLKSQFFLWEAPKHPPSHLYYCRLLPKKFLQSTSHFQGKPWDPPIKKTLDTPLLLYTVGKATIVTNHSKCKQHNEPMKTQSKCNRRQSRENACDQFAIGFDFASNWLSR